MLFFPRPSRSRSHSAESKSTVVSSSAATPKKEVRKTRVRPAKSLPGLPARYYVRIPKQSSSTSTQADVVTLRNRYPNLYLPSDFFAAHLACHSAFDVQHPFPLLQSNSPLKFRVLTKEEDDSGVGGEASTAIDPPDASRKYSAKVMLLSFPAFKVRTGICT